MTDQPQRSLEGLRVLDFSQVLAGPVCTAMLGALGAEVIRVENGARLDTMRRTYAEAGFTAPSFHLANHNKRGISLNLQSEEGVGLAKRLVGISDLVMMNFRPGVVGRLGLDYETLREQKPDLLMISISGLGQEGPEARYASYAAIFAALGGLSYLTGYTDGIPTEWRGSVDHRVGVAALGACLAGLYRLRNTGLGGHIDLSGREVQTTLLGDAVLEAQLSATPPEAMGNEDRIMAPHGCFLSLDADTWVTLAVGSDAEWQGFCEAAGSIELQTDELFGDGYRRWKRSEELNARAAEWVATQHGEDAVARLQQHGVPAALTLRMDQAAANEHLQSRSVWHQIQLPEVPSEGVPFRPQVSMIGAPWSFNGSRDAYRIEPGPNFAEGNEYVFLELLGLSREQYETLVDSGVIA